MLDQLSPKFHFCIHNFAVCHSGEIYEWTSFHPVLRDASHILPVSIDKRISFPLRFSLTAQEFGMAIWMKQMTLLTLDVEWLYFLTHSWTFECFSRAGPVTYRWLWYIQYIEKNTKMFIIILFYIFPSFLVGLFHNG